MAKRYEELEATFPPEVRSRIEELVRLGTAEMVIREVQGEREAARAVLARVIGVEPADLLEVERRVAAELAELEAERGPEEDAETRVVTLKARVASLGGRLQIKAIFPQGEIDLLEPKKTAEPEAKAVKKREPAAA